MVCHEPTSSGSDVFQGSFVGFSRTRLKSALEALGTPHDKLSMRVNQLWNAIYSNGAQDFQGITTLSKDFRAALSAVHTLNRPEIVMEKISEDGTRKWLLRFPPQRPGGPPNDIETVYIPDEERGTLCVSSQVGCTLNCSFCHTGTQLLVRNLTAAEIVAQLVVARDRLGDWAEPGVDSIPEDIVRPQNRRAISNIVFMGMGEPLYNFDNVKEAIDILSDGDGLSIGRRHITISTAGVVPEIVRAGEEMGCMLAISLHAVNDDLRNRLVPLNKKYPLTQLLDACRSYPTLSNARRITFEYVMLKDVNDSEKEAHELIRLLHGIPAKVNLIPFNPWPGTHYERSSWSRIEKFSEILFQAGISCPIRTPRGQDILAACGQLKSTTERLRKAKIGEPLSP
jgi:23S rRNA (adenine2503-C2)-methyltransferase